MNEQLTREPDINWNEDLYVISRGTIKIKEEGKFHSINIQGFRESSLCFGCLYTSSHINKARAKENPSNVIYRLRPRKPLNFWNLDLLINGGAFGLFTDEIKQFINTDQLEGFGNPPERKIFPNSGILLCSFLRGKAGDGFVYSNEKNELEFVLFIDDENEINQIFNVSKI